MAEYTQIKSAIWQDPEFEELAPLGKLLWLQLLTTPERNTAGLYRMSKRRMAFETGMSVEQTEEALSALVELGWVLYDEATGFVWVKNFVKRQPQSPSILTKALADVEQIGHGHPLVTAFLGHYGHLIPPKQGVDTPSIPPKQGVDRGVARGNGTERKEERNGTELERNGTEEVLTLVELARAEIPGWEPDAKDEATVQRGLDRLPEHQCERIILELAEYAQANSGKYKDLRRTLGRWFAKEAPEPQQRSRGQPEPDIDYPVIEVPETW